MKNQSPRFIVFVLIVYLYLFTFADAFSQRDSTADKKTYVSGLTPARAKSLIGVVIGLVSVIIGWRGRSRRSIKLEPTRSWAVTGVVFGVGAVVLGLVHLVGNTGAFGTGGGKAGAIVALLLGVIGAFVNVLVVRAKRGARESD